mmetsp:Transcript_4670/g.11100  ORF Transcript_4670/g.11100 Transcript_4670/m.11100 type:complete len:201 (-) Transcript_4670:30-632(-)
MPRALVDASTHEARKPIIVVEKTGLLGNRSHWCRRHARRGDGALNIVVGCYRLLPCSSAFSSRCGGGRLWSFRSDCRRGGCCGKSPPRGACDIRIHLWDASSPSNERALSVGGRGWSFCCGCWRAGCCGRSPRVLRGIHADPWKIIALLARDAAAIVSHGNGWKECERVLGASEEVSLSVWQCVATISAPQSVSQLCFAV